MLHWHHKPFISVCSQWRPCWPPALPTQTGVPLGQLATSEASAGALWTFVSLWPVSPFLNTHVHTRMCTNTRAHTDISALTPEEEFITLIIVRRQALLSLQDPAAPVGSSRTMHFHLLHAFLVLIRSLGSSKSLSPLIQSCRCSKKASDEMLCQH